MVSLSWKTLFIHSYIRFLPSGNVDKEILNLSNACGFAGPQIKQEPVELKSGAGKRFECLTVAEII